jgi:hypothetical protein
MRIRQTFRPSSSLTIVRHIYDPHARLLTANQTLTLLCVLAYGLGVLLFSKVRPDP